MLGETTRKSLSAPGVGKQPGQLVEKMPRGMTARGGNGFIGCSRPRGGA